MAVRVPFHLRRRSEPGPAVALLLAGDDPAGVLTACARLAHPLVFPVSGGFLLVADAVPDAIPQAVRLRRLSENLYLPADADLVPALRPPEAVDLTAGRGLVFLPNRDPLAFDPTKPLRPSAFLAVPKPRRDDWGPFPTSNPPADRLAALVREVTIPPDELLTGDGPPIGTDDVRPPQVGPGRRALGHLSAGLGKGIGAAGRAIGSSKLGNLGSKLKGLGAALAPRITEDLLGKQEAALQRLLQKFRGGQTDDALRQSIPVGADPGRGGGLYGSDRLPTNNLGWSFGGLFGSRTSSVWAGGSPDTWLALIAEYRRAAQQAADRGDFRRAALIYARLLTDYRAAAEVLSRGGLHREAGILFRDKVRQMDRAAREFEKAGEHDEALRLYREANLLVDAGDLLRRIGEEDAAIAEYHRAADRVIEQRQDFVEAGDLILKKTGRADLAGAYFANGWDTRTLALTGVRNATACAERLIEIYAFAEPRDPFWTLLGEVEDWLHEPGQSTEAGRFFNKVARLAELPHLRAERGEVRDRARLGLAHKVRQHAKAGTTPGTVIAELVGASGHWSPAVVSDADFALRSAMKGAPKPDRPERQPFHVVRLRDGEVTAVVQVPEGNDLLIGFKDGAVVHYAPAEHAQVVQPACGFPALALAVSADGGWLAGLWEDDDPPPHERARSYRLGLASRGPTGWESRSRSQWWADPGGLLGLLPVIEPSPDGLGVGVNTVNGVGWHRLPDLVPAVEAPSSSPLPATTHLRLWVPDDKSMQRFMFQGGSVSWFGAKAFIGWMPEPAPESPLYAPPLAWLVASPVHVELAGLYDKATLYWTEVERRPDRLGTRTVPFVAPGGFRGVAIWKPGHVVGVTGTNRVLWLRARGNRFEEWAPATELTLPARAAGCFTSRRTNEVLVVLADGTLARVPLPR